MRYVVSGDGLHRCPNIVGQSAYPRHDRGGCPNQSVAPHHVDYQEFGARLGGDTTCPAYQCLRFRTARDRDDYTLTCLPGLGDPVIGAVFGKRGVHLIGEPQQRQLTQRRQIACPEVVTQRRSHLFRRVNIAVNHPAPQCLRRDVHELNLLGAPHHRIGDGLALHDSGDLFDYVVQAFQMLHVDGGQHIDPGVQDLVDILPALGIPATRCIGVCHLVDEYQRWLPGQHRIDIQLVHERAAVGRLLGRNEL